MARLRKRSMVASENTVAGDLDADGVLALPENVRQLAHSLPSGVTNLYMFGLLSSNILSGMFKIVMTYLVTITKRRMRRSQ